MIASVLLYLPIIGFLGVVFGGQGQWALAAIGVTAGLSTFSRPESNGVTEGHVNRLKFLKRQMFGRAHLDLLRVKVLHAL